MMNEDNLCAFVAAAPLIAASRSRDAGACVRRAVPRRVTRHRASPLTRRWLKAAAAAAGAAADGAADAGDVSGAYKALPPQVVCYGEVVYDLMSNDQNAVMADSSAWTPYAGGAPTNVACALQALGVPTALFATVGADDSGEGLLSLLRGRGVDVSGVAVDAARVTRKIYVRRDKRSGEREFIGFGGEGENEGFADTAYFNMDEKGVRARLLAGAKAFVAGTVVAAFDGGARTLEELAKAARANGALVAIDVNWRDRIWAHWEGRLPAARERILRLLRLAHVVKASVDDVAFLFGDDAARRALDAPDDLRRALGVPGLLLTAGADGAACAFAAPAAGLLDADADASTNVVTARIAAFVPDAGVVDTTGAGDAFLAAFLTEVVADPDTALADRDHVLRAMRFAARAAGVVVTGIGAIAPLESKEQVDAITGSLAK